MGPTIFGLTEECLSIGNDHLLELLPARFIKLRQECFHVSFGTVGLHAIPVLVSQFSLLPKNHLKTHDWIVISPLEGSGETATMITCAPSQSAKPSAKDGNTLSAIPQAL